MEPQKSSNKQRYFEKIKKNEVADIIFPDFKPDGVTKGYHFNLVVIADFLILPLPTLGFLKWS
jgi:hypothetical protein